MSQEGPHLLFCAFAEVPGPTSVGTRVEQLVTAFSDEFDVDAMTLKGPELAHIQRMGAARVMRVPTEGKPFTERLASYRRALQRQLAGDHYDFVYCADLFSAQVASAFREAQGFALVVDVSDFPSESFDGRWPVDRGDRKLRAEWSRAEAQALLQATHLIAPSRVAARELSERVDARRVKIYRRAVDRTVFAPPSIEIGLDGQSVVVVGREAGARLAPTVAILTELAEQLSEDIRIAVVGHAPPEGEDTLLGALAATGLTERVDLVSVDTHVRMANVLSDATVVVVPSGAEAGAHPQAVPHRALEAMACRRATVLTGPFEAFRDTLVPDEEALVVPAGQPKEVTLAVLRLLQAPALRDAVAGAGLRRVEQEGDLSVRTQELASFITETIGVAMTPRPPESTDPAAGADDEPTGVSQAGPDSLPPPPFDTMDSGKHAKDEVRVGDEPARKPSRELVTPFDPLEPMATDTHTADSSVFTDEDRSGEPPLAPAAPAAPAAADRAASSIDASATASAVGASADTVVAPAPTGLEPLRIEQVPGLEGIEPDRTQLGDDWYGDTRIDSSRPPDASDPSLDAEETPRPVPPAASTVSASDLEAAPLRSLAVESDGTQSTSSPLGTGDPWAHDTIADAGPVFTDEKSEPKKDVPAPVSTSGRNFLVDPEAMSDPPVTNPALEEATADDTSLPKDSSGEG